MFVSSKSSSMATLLQQKNCMTTLKNGAVSGNNNNNGSNGTNNSTEKTDSTLNRHDVTSTNNINNSATTTLTSVTSSNGNGVPVLQPITTAYFPSQSTTIYSNSPQQNQNSDINLFHNFDITNNSSNSNFLNHQLQHSHVQSFTRYFSQFNHQETEFLNMSTSSESSHFDINTASINRTQPAYEINNTENNKQIAPFKNQPPTTTPITSRDDVQGKIESVNNDVEENSIFNDQQQQQTEEEPEPEIDIVINNVVCSFSVRCHLNLREIALNGFNVEFRRENGMVTMKLRRPYTTASIWSSGRITCTGATSEEQAKIAARRFARCLQKLGFKVRFHNFRVVNVLGTCSMPWAIKIVNFSEKYKKEASYEPELHPGVTYKLKIPKATLKIFSTGSVTVTAGSVAHVQAAIEHIFPLVYEFRKKRTPEENEIFRNKHPLLFANKLDDESILHSPTAKKKIRPPGFAENDPNEDIMYVSDYDDDDDQIDAE